MKVKGVLQKNGTTIDSIKTLHDGMGFFFLIPEQGARYLAKWKDAKNKEQTTELPTPRTGSGITMQIGIGPGKRFFSLNPIYI